MALTISGFTMTGNLTAVHIPPLPPQIYLWSWGNNFYGQLGIGNTTYYSSPKQIGALTNWLSIAGGGYHNLAIKTDGSLWSWGRNYNGMLGLGNTTQYSSPVQVGALTTWSTIAAGNRHLSMAIKTDGTLWTWGYNPFGQLGLGDAGVNRSSPVQVGALTTWSKISAGQANSAAIKTDGTMWTWGQGTYGNLGLGNTTSRSSPVQVGALTNWLSVAAAYHCMAIKTDGTLWAWGDNYVGTLGLGDTTTRSSPVQVGDLTTWSSIAVNGAGSHNVGVATDGTLWAWGWNSKGQVGDGTTTNKSSPVQIGALTTWSKISMGPQHSVAIKTNNTIWTWGLNSSGQLGLGNITDRSSPVQIGTLTAWSNVSAGKAHIVAIGAV